MSRSDLLVVGKRTVGAGEGDEAAALKVEMDVSLVAQMLDPMHASR